MSSILAILLGRLEGWFDRAMERDGRGDTARGEFISTLIIDHGAASREAENRQRRGGPRG
jgi:hypothetical protein